VQTNGLDMGFAVLRRPLDEERQEGPASILGWTEPSPGYGEAPLTQEEAP
jgi:hypothetical protein